MLKLSSFERYQNKCPKGYHKTERYNNQQRRNQNNSGGDQEVIFVVKVKIITAITIIK